MLKLALTVVAIALPDSINPSLIGGELFVAIGAHPRRRTLAFTLAAFIVTFLFGLVFALGLGDLILSVLPKPGKKLKYELIAFAGLVLVLGGALVWFRRHKLAAAGLGADRLKSHGSAAVIGAGIAGVELLTAFPYFAAIAMIVGSGVSLPSKVSLIVLYCIVYMLPLIAMVVVFAVLGERAERLLRPAGDWLMGHWPLIVGPLTAAIGAAVFAFGIYELTTL